MYLRRRMGFGSFLVKSYLKRGGKFNLVNKVSCFLKKKTANVSTGDHDWFPAVLCSVVSSLPPHILKSP